MKRIALVLGLVAEHDDGFLGIWHWEYENGARLLSQTRQMPGCKNDMSNQVIGTTFYDTTAEAGSSTIRMAMDSRIATPGNVSSGKKRWLSTRAAAVPSPPAPAPRWWRPAARHGRPGPGEAPPEARRDKVHARWNGLAC